MVTGSTLGQEDVVQVETPVASCNGQGLGASQADCSGHPLVYLAMGEEGRATCPYCSRQFVLVGQAGH